MSRRKKKNKVSFRVCAACGEKKKQKEMFRLPDTRKSTDSDSGVSAGGRSMYLCHQRKCIRKGLEEHLITQDEGKRLLEELKEEGWQFLGLAAKAGMVSSGETAVEDAIQSGKACFVILAADASENTRKKFQNKCSFYQIPCIVTGNREMTGKRIGKELRSCVSVNDSNFADQISGLLSD